MGGLFFIFFYLPKRKAGRPSRPASLSVRPLLGRSFLRKFGNFRRLRRGRLHRLRQRSLRQRGFRLQRFRRRRRRRNVRHLRRRDLGNGRNISRRSDFLFGHQRPSREKDQQSDQRSDDDLLGLALFICHGRTPLMRRAKKRDFRKAPSGRTSSRKGEDKVAFMEKQGRTRPYFLLGFKADSRGRRHNRLWATAWTRISTTDPSPKVLLILILRISLIFSRSSAPPRRKLPSESPP